MLQAFTLIVLPLSLLSCSCLPDAPPNRASVQIQQILMSAEVTASARPGEPIVVTVCVKNLRDQRISLEVPPRSDSAIKLRAFDDQGTELAPFSFRRVSLLTHWDLRPPIELKAGDEYRQRFDVRDQFLIDRPGEYRLNVSCVTCEPADDYGTRVITLELKGLRLVVHE